jgi:hypothetical protein
MGLLRDMGQVEACFNSFGDNVNLDTGLVHGLRRMCNWQEIIMGAFDGTHR